MAMVLESVVPFGRSLSEYCHMFNLDAADLHRRIVGIGDGPASFNAEMTHQGKPVISIDPVYQFTGPEIRQRFDAVVDPIIDQIKATPNDWVWTYHKSPEDLRQRRIHAIDAFLADYDRGKAEARYVVGELPHLPWADGYFDLALCSHFLFLYSDHYDYDFHRRSLLEMLRISAEIRIFPLMTLALKPSPYVAPIIQELTRLGYRPTVETVPYELQVGGNQMLKIVNPAVPPSSTPPDSVPAVLRHTTLSPQSAPIQPVTDGPPGSYSLPQN
jgi:hypothetical protein